MHVQRQRTAGFSLPPMAPASGRTAGDTAAALAAAHPTRSLTNSISRIFIVQRRLAVQVALRQRRGRPRFITKEYAYLGLNPNKTSAMQTS